MSEDIPGHPLEQGEIVDIRPNGEGSKSTCQGCGAESVAHLCHGPAYKCSDCCGTASAGEGDCQRFIARERGGALLVNRRHTPTGWGGAEQWPVDRDVVDIGRARSGNAVMTNTEPGKPGWLGNPYKLKSAGGDYTREESVQKFRSVFYRMAAENERFREHVLDLRGKILMGWCVPKLCHGDVLLEYLHLNTDAAGSDR